MRIGFLDDVGADKGFGWFYSLDPTESPLIVVDGAVADILDTEIARPDVGQALGVENATGFSYTLPKDRRGQSVTLYAVSESKVSFVARKMLQDVENAKPYSFLTALRRARELSADPDAVAITCWDGTHNPVGRAKVLYDIAAMKNPTMLFAYEFSEFGSGIWAPLANADLDYMLIPWEDRDIYHEILRRNGVVFDAIWMCKPRLPTFLLTQQLSHSNTRLILDFDDNEEHFSRSSAARGRAFGETTVGLSGFLADQIRSRTCASVTLQQRYSGELVRHVRVESRSKRPRAKSEKIRFGFIGTVRPHKGVETLAKALKIAAIQIGEGIELHVLGTVEPPKLKKDLQRLGVTVGGIVPTDELPDRISDMDFLITGYPEGDGASDPVTEYQITAKIGDALANGRPVFVPRTNGVRDLDDTDGIYLFDGDDLATQILRAMRSDRPVVLPEEFTIEHGRRIFEKQLALAGDTARAKQALKMVPGPEILDRAPFQGRGEAHRTVLLVWKQHDGGIYGRRIDQIARALKVRNPHYNVIVLQLLREQTERDYEFRARVQSSEFAQVLQKLHEGGGEREHQGVVYKTIRYRVDAALVPAFNAFMADNEIYPDNSVVILFPIVKALHKLNQILRPYTTIVDVVDNQFGWAKNNNVNDLIVGYAETLMLGDHIVFNSSLNRDFFARSFGDVLKSKHLQTIPNWYAYPPVENEQSGARNALPGPEDSFNIVYSGNLNDRVNFELIRRIVSMSPRIKFFLMGTADRVGEDFYELLRENVVYLGPTDEAATIEILKFSQLAVMPHIDDEVSRFMNPLKLHMYQYFKLPCVSSHVAGIDAEGTLLTVCRTDDEFLEAVAGHFERWSSGIRIGVKKNRIETTENANMLAYCQMVEHYLAQTQD